MSNYTVSQYTITDEEDTVLPASVNLTITPDPGYVIAAADFTTENLPASITAVSFSDSAAAYSLENVVTASLTVNYTIGTADAEILVDIDGRAEYWDPDNGSESRSVTSVINVLDPGIEGSRLVTTAPAGVTRTAITHSSGYSGFQYSLTSNRNEPQAIANFTLSVDGDYFLEGGVLPDFAVGNPNGQDFIDIVITGSTEDANGGVTQIQGQVLTKSNGDVPTSSDVSVLLNSTVVDDIFVDDVITGIGFGSNIVATKGETRILRVFGTPGATGSFVVQLNRVNQAGYPTNITIPDSGVMELVYTFPEFKGSGQAKRWTMAVSGTGSTTVASDVPNSGSLDAFQYQQVSLSLGVDVSNYSAGEIQTVPTAEVFTGPAYAFGDNLAHSGFESVRTIQWSMYNTIDVWRIDPSADVNDWAGMFTNQDSSTNGGTDFTIIKENVAISGRQATITLTVALNVFGNASVNSTVDMSRILMPNTPRP